jgi:hypothetical protein
MPKRFFHDVFAGHTDDIFKKADNRYVHINKAGFNCDCNSIVVTSPFTEHHIEDLSFLTSEYKTLILLFSIEVFSQTHSFFALRGPPCLV